MPEADTEPDRNHQQPSSGRLAAAAGSVTALITATLASSALTFWQRDACRAGAWNHAAAPLRAHCYSDIYALYFYHRLSQGKIPYLDRAVEYPVLIGAVMEAAAWPVHTIAGLTSRGRAYFDLTSAVLVLCAITGVLFTAYLAGRSRRWTALLLALAPGLILTAWVNWDLLAMALTAAAMAAWAKQRSVLAGALFGLAVATKFYPLILLAALLPLCLRAGRLHAFWVTTGAAAVTWLAVNVPVAVAAFTGWSAFYRLSESRGGDRDTIWDVIRTAGHHLGPATLNVLVPALYLVAFALLALLVLAAPRRPRVPQVLFLALAVFLMLNKVWSPQYVIWLLPLAVLARPRLWAFLLWQAAEAVHFFTTYAYVLTADPYYRGEPGGIGTGPYLAALLARFLTVALLCALVVRDILRPATDLVRRDGEDDPAGGVLAGAPDAVTIAPGARPRLIRPAGEAAGDRPARRRATGHGTPVSEATEPG